MTSSSLTMFDSLTTEQKIAFLLVWAWSIVWKGIALWNTAKKDKKYWFIAILVINTIGILEIIYLLLFNKPTVLKKSSSKKVK